MKRDNPLLKTISAKVIKEETMDFDFTRLVVADEFNRPGIDHYEARAVNRLVKSGEPFYNETNITYELMKRFISVKCPYCKKQMSTTGGRGSIEWTTNYRCTCNATASITVKDSSSLLFQKGDK